MDAVFAAAAGVLGRLPCHPLDTVKTVAFAGHYGSSSPQQATSSVRDVIRSIYRAGGISGFYRGVGIAVAGAAPGNVLYFVSYDTFKRNGELLLDEASWPSAKKSLVHLLSGFAAEAVSCIVWVPIDVAKERLQSQPPQLKGRYRSSLDALRTIGAHEKLRGLYKGYFGTLASFGPFSAVYFLAVEQITDMFPLAANTDAASGEYFVATMKRAAAANVVASVATNPFELVKTRLQIQRSVLNIGGVPQHSNQFRYEYAGMWDGLRSMIREEGVLSLWRGTTARVLYACPNSAITFSLYRTFQSMYRAKHDGKVNSEEASTSGSTQPQKR